MPWRTAVGSKLVATRDGVAKASRYVSTQARSAATGTLLSIPVLTVLLVSVHLRNSTIAWSAVLVSVVLGSGACSIWWQHHRSRILAAKDAKRLLDGIKKNHGSWTTEAVLLGCGLVLLFGGARLISHELVTTSAWIMAVLLAGGFILVRLGTFKSRVAGAAALVAVPLMLSAAGSLLPELFGEWIKGVISRNPVEPPDYLINHDLANASAATIGVALRLHASELSGRDRALMDQLAQSAAAGWRDYAERAAAAQQFSDRDLVDSFAQWQSGAANPQTAVYSGTGFWLRYLDQIVPHSIAAERRQSALQAAADVLASRFVEFFVEELKFDEQRRDGRNGRAYTAWQLAVNARTIQLLSAKVGLRDAELAVEATMDRSAHPGQSVDLRLDKPLTAMERALLAELARQRPDAPQANAAATLEIGHEIRSGILYIWFVATEHGSLELAIRRFDTELMPRQARAELEQILAAGVELDPDLQRSISDAIEDAEPCPHPRGMPNTVTRRVVIPSR